MESRRLYGVPKHRVIQYRLPEVLQRALPQWSITSSEVATNLNNWLFDFRAKRKVNRPPILHFVNTLGLSFAREVRREGGLVICDCRQEHPLTQNRLLLAEAEMRGLRHAHANATLTERMLGEFEASHRIIVPSRFARNTFLDNGVDEAKLSIIPYGVDAKVFPPKLPSEGRDVTLLFVGTLSLRKGVLYLLEALKNLKLPRLRALFIGGMDPGMEELLAPYRHLFTHLPNIPKIGLRQYYQRADFFVLPSIADAYPLAILEAAATGLPVITTTNVGSCDMLVNGKSGVIVPPADVAALTAAIELLYRSAEQREQMGQFNRSLAAAFTWNAYKTRLIEEYRRTILCPQPE